MYVSTSVSGSTVSKALLKSKKMAMIDLWLFRALWRSVVNTFIASKVFSPGQKPNCLLFKIFCLLRIVHEEVLHNDFKNSREHW